MDTGVLGQHFVRETLQRFKFSSIDWWYKIKKLWRRKLLEFPVISWFMKLNHIMCITTQNGRANKKGIMSMQTWFKARCTTGICHCQNVSSTTSALGAELDGGRRAANLKPKGFKNKVERPKIGRKNLENNYRFYKSNPSYQTIEFSRKTGAYALKLHLIRI